MYYGVVRELAQAVLHYIRRHGLLKPGDRAAVGVSGGADSVALLRLLLELRAELGVVLSVVHFNHQLRGPASDADEKFVSALAQKHKLELHSSGGDVAAYAKKNHLSVEAGARALRYQYFRTLMEAGSLSRIATGHTLDDQAETVLLRLARGAGTRGLAGIYPQLSGPGSRFSVVRPLLSTRRLELEEYLHALGQEWREDASNRDLRFARNRVRHGILPRLQQNLNPEVHAALAETAEIARAEEEYWEREIARILPQISDWKRKTLNLSALRDLPLALQRRVVRATAESLGLRLTFRQVEEILDAVAGDAVSSNLPGGWTVSRRQGLLQFEAATTSTEIAYAYRLPVPGQVRVAELGLTVETSLILIGGGDRGYNPEHLFDRSKLSKELTVRNWRPGDRFWPAHTKSPKKIKELLQERHVTGPQRQTWPVVASGDQIIWLRGFTRPAQLRPPDGASEAVLIQEKVAGED